MVDLNSTGDNGENDSANGIFTIDAEAAENTFKEVLSKNLGLDEYLSPLKNSILTSWNKSFSRYKNFDFFRDFFVYDLGNDDVIFVKKNGKLTF